MGKSNADGNLLFSERGHKANHGVLTLDAIRPGGWWVGDVGSGKIRLKKMASQTANGGLVSNFMPAGSTKWGSEVRATRSSEASVADKGGTAKEQQPKEQQPKDPSGYTVGMKVECRDHGEHWRSGVVKKLDPLQVQPDTWDTPHPWDEVRP